MVLAFTLGPIRHAFTPTKPLSPNSACSVPPLPTTWITRPSAELQPTCWAKGSWVFRCHNKNRSVPHSFNDGQTYQQKLFYHPFHLYDLFPPTSPSISSFWCLERHWRQHWHDPGSLQTRVTALTFLMLRHVSKLARHMSPYYDL